MNHACQKASRIASDALERPLSFTERLSYRLHMAICQNCRHHDQTIHLIRNITSGMRESRFGEVTLPDARREQLRNALTQVIKQPPDS